MPAISEIIAAGRSVKEASDGSSDDDWKPCEQTGACVEQVGDDANSWPVTGAYIGESIILPNLDNGQIGGHVLISKAEVVPCKEQCQIFAAIKKKFALDRLNRGQLGKL